MGAACGAAAKQVQDEVKKRQSQMEGGGGGSCDVAVGDVIVIYQYNVMGEVTEVIPKTYKGGKDKVMLKVKDGPNGDSEPDEYPLSDFKKLSEIPAINPFLPSMKCTADYRGSKVNGWVVACKEDGKVTVKYLPDAAHDKVDKTHWALGERKTYEAGDVTAGHTGDERPRNRTVDEIAEEKSKVLSYGISYVYCGRCEGRGIWDDPCDCYVKRANAFACAQCGEKQSSENAVCCGERISENAQNQGWVSTLANQYGYF